MRGVYIHLLYFPSFSLTKFKFPSFIRARCVPRAKRTPTATVPRTNATSVAHRRIYGYLFSGFVGRAWYWEIWNSVRKCLITACSILFQSWGVAMQTWAALGLMEFFLALFVHMQPYRKPVLNRLELYALTADFVTLFLLITLVSITT